MLSLNSGMVYPVLITGSSPFRVSAAVITRVQPSPLHCMVMVYHAQIIGLWMYWHGNLLLVDLLIFKHSIHTIGYFTLLAFFSQSFVHEAGALGRTKDHLWKPIIDSFKILESGIFNGKRIVGGMRFVLWAIKGDADFCINFFELPGHWSSEFPCMSCLAVSKPAGADHHFLNFETHAPWKDTLFTDMDSYYAHCVRMRKSIHPVFSSRDNGGLGLHISTMYKDVLHVVDLGVSKHVIGNVLWHLVFTDIIRPTRHTNMETVWGEIQNLYKERGTTSQFNSISIKSFTNPDSPNRDFPVMSGKGAECRHLIPILQSVFERFARKDCLIRLIVRCMLYVLPCMYFTVFRIYVMNV